MSADSHPDAEPRELLAETRELARRVRRAQRGTWAALLVLGTAVLLAIPFYRYSPSSVTHCQAAADDLQLACVRYPALALWYWPLALVVAYVVIGAIFVHRARTRGVGARVRPYVVWGILLVGVASLVAFWAVQHPLWWAQIGAGLGSQAQPWLHRLVGPLGVIGLGLLILAVVERSRALAAFSVVYLTTVVASAPTRFHGGPPSPWAFLPGVLVPGLVLLAGSGVFGVLERPGTGGPGG